MPKVLITGGAGFIGSNIVDLLHQSKANDIVVFDNFSVQIHGVDYKDSYLYKSILGKCEIIKGDVRNRNELEEALKGIDIVIHLAAETGTGQSMYEIAQYTDTNIVGTTNLIDILLNKKIPLKKIILSSSRAIYGEGMYRCLNDGIITADIRDIEIMKQGKFDNFCPICGEKLHVVPTKEECIPHPISYYACTKLVQETILQTMCPMLNIPYTIFRYQNVYGIGQSLENPYTGILSIFSKLLLQNQDLNIFEDGIESRDFVNVKDVAALTCDAILNKRTDNQIINVGTGEKISVIQVAKLLKKYYESSSKLHITGNFRKGDIRNNIADISKAIELCDYRPMYDFDRGMEEFTEWVKDENRNGKLLINDGRFEKSIDEMKKADIFVS